MRTFSLLVLGLILLTFEAEAQETDIDRALLAAARDSSQRIQFYSEFVNALVYVPTDARPAQVENGSRTGVRPSFRPLIVEREGTPYGVAFDRLERLEAWTAKEAGYVAVAASSLVETLVEQYPGTSLSLNPGTEYPRDFHPAELTWLLKSMQASDEPARVAGDTEVYLGRSAADAPPRLLNALVAHLSGEPRVIEAYMTQFAMEGGSTGLLLVLKLDDGTRETLEQIHARIGEAVQDELPERTALTVALYSKDGVTQHVPETGRLIYKR